MDEWVQQAACRGLPTVWWYPTVPLSSVETVNMRKAKRICLECVVRADCLKAGLGEDYGIWGGVGTKTRVAIRQAGKREKQQNGR